MPIVFVHGVNTRRNEDYDEAEKQRNIFFKRYFSNLRKDQTPLKDEDIHNPYWGDYGAELKWDLASLGREESFGPTNNALAVKLTDQAIELTSEPNTNNILPKMARVSLVETVDLLFAQAIEDADEKDRPELMDLAHKTWRYAQHNPTPDWLTKAKDNYGFYTSLQEAVEDWTPDGELLTDETITAKESFGGTTDKAKRIIGLAYKKIQNISDNIRGRVVTSARTVALQRYTLFLGDAFKYVQYRGDKEHPGAIVREVMKYLDIARDAQSATDPLILIAHSMGGNICYDILSYYRPDIHVDFFITVGSQVPFLRDLELLNKKDANIPGTGGGKVPKLKNVKYWLNVYNTSDFLSFPCDPIFEGVTDYKYNSGIFINPMTPHSAYFSQTSFYEELVDCLRSLPA